MCGITGWISYDSDLTTERDTLSAMTEPMACRGPDATGTWLDTHAALGHRRLAVIDIEGGKQPMTVREDGRTLLVTTYSGEVYNYRELRGDLESRGHTFRTSSDTEVVLHAYLEWGEQFTERLNGMYAFALWDPRREELLLVRDRMGIKPLYYYPTPDGVLFGSEPKAVLAHPAARAVIDAEGLAKLLSIAKTPGHAVYKGMYELRPGHTLRVRREGRTERRYWGLESHEHTDDLDTTVTHVRELLDDIVARQLIADVPLCSLLSGGLDSSVITALAARDLAAEGRGPVRSFAVDFTGHTEGFQATKMRGTPDGPYAHALAEHVGADHSVALLDTDALMDPVHRGAVLRSRDLPMGLGEGDTSLYLLFRSIREHSTVALSGEAADEVFGGYQWFHDEAAVNADTFPWIAAGRARSFAGADRPDSHESLFDPALLDKIDISGYREAIAEVAHLPGESAKERRMREISHLHLTRFVQILLDRKDRISMVTGLEVRVPFCDHRLVQYVFNTPWAMKTFDGREKSLLRAATRDVLPDTIADRVKSPYPSTQDPRYPLALRDELRRLRADSASPAHDFLAAAGVADACEDATGGPYRTSMEFTLSFDAWLREYGVSVEV